MSAGDFKQMRNASNVDAYPPTVSGSLLLLWDTPVANTGSGITYSDGTFTLGETGRFLVMVSDQWGTTDITANMRTNPELRMELAGASLEPVGYSTGFIRRASGSQEFINFSCAVIEVTTTAGNGDELEFYTLRIDTSTAGTVNRIPDRSGVTIIKLRDDWDYARYTGAPFTPSATDNVRNVADLSTTVEEDSVFSRTGNTVTINTNNFVLCLYSFMADKSDVVSGRTEVQGVIDLAGTEVPGSWSQTYGPRQTQDSLWGGMSCMCLLEPTSGDALQLMLVGREDIDEDWEAALQLIELPSSAQKCIVEATTGNFNVVATDFAWDTQGPIDTGVFTHTPGQANVDVDLDDDYLVMVSQVDDTDAGIVAVRAVPVTEIFVNSSPHETTGSSSYIRGNGTADHAGNACATLLAGLSAGDSIITHNDKIGTNSTAIVCTSGAMSIIRLSTLFPREEIPPIKVLSLAGQAPVTINSGSPDISIAAAALRLTVSRGLKLFGYPPLPIDSVNNHTAVPAAASLALTGEAAPTFNWIINTKIGITNLGLWSQDWTNWTETTNVDLSNNAPIEAPDNTITGNIIRDDNSGGTGQIRMTRTGIVNIPVRDYTTVSIYFKSGSIDWVFPNISNLVGIGASAYMDGATPAIGTVGADVVASGIESATVTFPHAPAGWFRGWFAFLNEDDAGGTPDIRLSTAGVNTTDTVLDGNTNIYLWGYMVQASGDIPGRAPTRYVPTEASQVTVTGLLRGFPPTIVNTRLIEPAAATLTLAGQAPSVEEDHFIEVAEATLILAGQAPGLDEDSILIPDVGALVLAGQASTLGHAVLTPSDRANQFFESNELSTDVTYWVGGSFFTITPVTSIYPGKTAYQHICNAASNRSRNQTLTAADGVWAEGRTDWIWCVIENIDAVDTRLGLYDQDTLGWVRRMDFTWATHTFANVTGSGGEYYAALGTGPNGGELALIGIGATGNNTPGANGEHGNVVRGWFYPTGTATNSDTVIMHHAQLEFGEETPVFVPIFTALSAETGSRITLESHAPALGANRSPAIAALDLLGHVPTFSNLLDTPVAPRPAELRLTVFRGLELFGYAPVAFVTTDHEAFPPAGALTLATHAIITDPVFEPPAATLDILGYLFTANTQPFITISVPEAPLSLATKIPERGRGLLFAGHEPNVALSTPTVNPALLVLDGKVPLAINTSVPPIKILVAKRNLVIIPENVTAGIQRPTDESSLILEGWAPVSTASSPVFFPPEAPLVLTPHVIASDHNITPPAGTLVLAGQAPTISLSVNPQVAPAVVSLSLTGQNVALFADTQLFQPGSVALTLNGQDVTRGGSITPEAIAVDITGHVPVALIGITRIETPAIDALTLSGQAPAVNVGPLAAPAAAAALVLTGYVPTVTRTQGHLLLPDAATLILASSAPVFLDTLSALPSAATLTVTGYSLTWVLRRVGQSGARTKLISQTIKRKVESINR